MDREPAMDGRRDGPALAGTTEVLPLADLVQLLVVNGRTGRLVLEGPGPGLLAFHEGRLVVARAGTARGRKAFLRAFAWEPVRFRWDPAEGPGEADPDLPGDVRGLVMEALVHRDELRRVAPDLPPPGTRLALAGDGPDRGPDPALAAVVARLAGGPATVAELLDLPGHADADLARAIVSLVREARATPAP